MNEETSRFHERVSALLADALELPEAERVAHVRAAAAGDAALEREVLSLLGWTDDEELDVALPAAEPEPFALVNEVPGYRVIRVIGEGGMGTVYEAEQLEPNRRVALKVIRGFSSSPEALRRFRREADLLARLHHPGICQVHEVGRTAGGLPFLSMELIDGRPLTRFAEEEELGRAERLALICRVCEAVAHAHERGIVHRDLKPENVLVTPDGRPKVVDFGIARATQPSQASTLLTGTGSILGTLSYMSPEQAAGERGVDHRADVFSLGVMAFELLTGRLPMELGELSFPQALYQIQQADLSMAGRGEPTLRGDLETILGKALEREPERRYPTAEAMAADVRRHLEHEPIVARRPSLGYRARKFTRRHRTMVSMVSLLLLTLTAASVVSLRQAGIAKQRADEAEWQSYRAVIGAAQAACESEDVPRAAELLEDAPRHLRGWEAAHLAALVRQGLGRLVRGEPGWALSLAAEGHRAHVVSGSREAPDLLELDLPDLQEAGRWPILADPLVVPGGARGAAVAARLAAGPLPAGLRLVDADTGEELAVLRACESTDSWTSAAVSPDGLLAVPLGTQGVVRVCDLSSGEWTAADFGGSSGAPVFSLDGSLLALASTAGASVHEVSTGALVFRLPSEGDAGTTVAFSPDGRFLHASGMGAHPYLDSWELSTGRLAGRLPVAGGSPGALWGVAPNGERLAWAPAIALLVVDADLKGEPLRRWAPGGVQGVALAEDGALLLAAQGERGLRAWDLTLPPARQLWRAHDSYVYDVAFSPDGRLLASAGWDGRARVWDAETQELLTSADAADGRLLHGVDFSADSERLVVADSNGVLNVLDAATGRELARRTGLPPEASVSARPGGDELLLASNEGLLLLDEATLETRAQLGWAHQAAWSPDGRRLAIVDEDGALSVLEAEGLAPVWTAAPSANSGLGLPAWSDDGRLLAAAGSEGVALFDARGGRLLRRLPQVRRLWCLDWSPDARRLVSGSDDGRVRIWDAATGEPLLVLKGHDSYVKAVTFDPTGRRIASASGDGRVGLWSAVADPESSGPGRD